MVKDISNCTLKLIFAFNQKILLLSIAWFIPLGLQ